MNVLSWTVDTEGWGKTEFMHDLKSLKTDKSFGWQYGQCACRDCEPKWTCVGIVMCFHIQKASMRTHTVLNTKPIQSMHIYQWISWIFNQKLQEDGVRSNKKRNNIMQHSSRHCYICIRVLEYNVSIGSMCIALMCVCSVMSWCPWALDSNAKSPHLEAPFLLCVSYCVWACLSVSDCGCVRRPIM